MNGIVKICGLSTPESIATTVAGGATHLGFIFFEKSPRHVTAQRVAELTHSMEDIETVAVTVNASPEILDDIVSVMKPRLLQLHGGESVERVSEVKARYGLPVVKAIAMRGKEDIGQAKSYDGVADLLLLDAKPPEGADLPGGNGVSFDWDLVGDLQSQSPIVLSGGLSLANLEEAQRLVSSDKNSFIGLDVSSGVESAPGVKDVSKIKAFLTACQPGSNK